MKINGGQVNANLKHIRRGDGKIDRNIDTIKIKGCFFREDSTCLTLK